MFVDSVRHFKERFYIVRPLTELTMDSLFESEFVTNEEWFCSAGRGRGRNDEVGISLPPMLDEGAL
ncbi:hypothetical protein A2U01_0105684 [Trifolium medium]|uniref:Uncharacterized protein n=1 Tax=Trifolium medium TaxID=97028 RepID=A0A392V7X3_9FABA|nr:hypothetical protein [Trifolium medium]